MSTKRFETITTERLLIRNLEPGDASAFFAYKSKPEATRFQFWRPGSLDEIKEFILDMESVGLNCPGTWLQLAICLKENGWMVGDIGLHFSRDDDAMVEIGYTVSPNYQHKGYATEAVRAIVGYLFNILNKHRVIASVDPRNAPSSAVLQRVGFRQEAHFIKSIFMDGEWCDDCVYALLKDEWH